MSHEMSIGLYVARLEGDNGIQGDDLGSADCYSGSEYAILRAILEWVDEDPSQRRLRWDIRPDVLFLTAEVV